MSTTRTRLDLKGIEIIRARLDAVVQTALMQTAIAVRDEYKELAEKDTEAMSESAYIATEEMSDYDETMAVARAKFNAAKALGKTPKGVRLGKNSKLFELPPVQPNKPKTVWVAIGTGYAAGQEFDRNPALTPAVLHNKGMLTQQIRVAVSGLSAKIKYKSFSRL